MTEISQLPISPYTSSQPHSVHSHSASHRPIHTTSQFTTNPDGSQTTTTIEIYPLANGLLKIIKKISTTRLQLSSSTDSTSVPSVGSLGSLEGLESRVLYGRNGEVVEEREEVLGSGRRRVYRVSRINRYLRDVEE